MGGSLKLVPKSRDELGDGLEPRSVCDAMVSFVDITPTFIDIENGPL